MNILPVMDFTTFAMAVHCFCIYAFNAFHFVGWWQAESTDCKYLLCKF